MWFQTKVIKTIKEFPRPYKTTLIIRFTIPEVSWVGLLLERMEGFPSPFESLRTILWY